MIADVELQARRNLLRVARRFAEAKGYKMITVSRYATGSPYLFDELQAREDAGGERADNKGSVTFRVYLKTLRWFDEHWPEGIESLTSLLDDITHNPERIHDGTDQRISQQGTEKAQERQGTETGGGNHGGSASGLLAKLRRNVG